MSRVLRDYQAQSIERVKEAWRRGAKGIFLCLPTGAGKTVCFTEVIREFVGRGNRCVVTAHRGELIHQAGKTIDGNGMFHGVIKAKPSTFPLAPIQVVSIDSMASRGLPWEPDLIIVDEAHLVNSARYRDFLALYPNAKVLLVSATPVRLDGRGFADLAQELVVGATIDDLIHHPEGPFLVPPRLYSGADLSGLDDVKTTAGDYNLGQLETLMSGISLVGDIVEQYKRLALGRKGVVFCVGIHHSQTVCQQFNEAGIRAEHIDGTLSETARTAILSRLRAGETQIVTNANVLCEGWDEPSISYVGLARPTKSLALYIQQAGRGLRICPQEGKTDCVIVDHGNNVALHGHLLEERYWSLDGRSFRKKDKPEDRRCFVCRLWLGDLKQCPNCGPHLATPREVNVIKADFQEVQKPVYNEVQRHYRRLLRYAKDHKRGPGYAYIQTLKKYGQGAVNASLTLSDSKRYQDELYY